MGAAHENSVRQWTGKVTAQFRAAACVRGVRIAGQTEPSM